MATALIETNSRMDELIFQEFKGIRRSLAGHKPIEAIERLLFFIRKYPTNDELLKNLPG